MISMHSLVEELPNLGIILIRTGNATPLLTMARTRILKFADPNFQLVLSIASRCGGSSGSSVNTKRAIDWCQSNNPP
jgi:hypothetical protein